MPIAVTVFGIVTEVILSSSSNLLYLENAFAAIDVTPSGITTAPVQFNVLVVTTLFSMLNEPPPLHATLIVGGISALRMVPSLAAAYIFVPSPLTVTPVQVLPVCPSPDQVAPKSFEI